MTSQSTPPSPPGKPARSTQTPTPGYHWSPLTREHVDPWATLVNHLATVDGTEEFYSPGDLAEEFDSPKLDPQRDLVA
ncbi:MAG TPA: hypothetical protein VK063_10730, partial [Beutenbergiaceae bacterium]|nr:hypothetical protein [Beutenbergiaceae bacterium]